MKTFLFAFLLLLIPKLCFSQLTANDDAMYLDSLFRMGSAQNYKYIRITKDYHTPNQKYFEIIDYYKSGKIAMSGNSTTRDKITKSGIFVYFYENGNKKAETYYEKNNPVGKNNLWYENGNRKEEGEYLIVDEKKNESKYKVNLFWDVNGVQKVIDGNGEYEEKWNNFFASGKVKDGFKDGIWEGYDKKIDYTFTETYENQKLVSGVSIDKEKTSHIYSIIEKKPKPKNGIEDFYKHVSRNFKTPDIKGLRGKVIVGFVIDKNGEIIEPKILQSVGFGADEEAIKVVTSFENFIPGEIRGIKVRCSYSLPIVIQPIP